MGLRRVLPQALAAAAKNSLLLSYGMSLGFPTIVIPQVSADRKQVENDTEVLRLSLAEISWISSINLLAIPVGCLLSGRMAQRFGRKRSMMFLNLPILAAWFIYNRASSAGSIYLGLVLTGLVGGFIDAPVLTYVAEIAEPRLRGMLSATAPMCVLLGVFIQFFLGSVYSWRTVALINTTVPLFSFLAISQVPESPHWLIVKGRIEEAKKALCWLRGWVGEEEVVEELIALKKVLAEKETPKRSWEPYLSRTFFLPFSLIVYLLIIGHFGGMTPLQTFAVGMFREVGSPLDEYTATVILGLAQLLGSLVCVGFVKFTGRRKLAISTLTLFALSFLSVGFGTFFAPGHGHLYLLGLLAGAFLTGCAIRPMPWILMGEVYPPDIKSTASALSGGIGYLVGFAANKSYLYLHSWLGLSGTLVLYGTVSFFGALGCFVVLPETEGKSLADVEKCFAKTKEKLNAGNVPLL